MEKPEYIKNLETETGKFLSKISIEELEMKDDPFDEKYYTLLFADLDYVAGGVFWKEKIFKTKHAFYIYVKKNVKGNYVIDIYHNPEQLNELIIFTRQFIKKNRK